MKTTKIKYFYIYEYEMLLMKMIKTKLIILPH